MSAYIADYLEAQGEGAPLDRELLKQQINYAGAVCESNTLELVLEKIQKGESVKNLRRIAHPETEVYISGRKYQVQEQLRNVTFYYDPENDAVAAK